MLHVWYMCVYIFLQNWVILGKGKCWQMLVCIFQHHGSHMGYTYVPPINLTVDQVINLAIDSGLHLQKESQI